MVALRAVSLVVILAWLAGAASPSRRAWETPPGWTDTRGGEGGKLFRVTSLDARGPGSLAEALAADGPRTIEFAVAGTIDLGGRSLRIARPFVTIAGETAVSPGITLANGGIYIVTHDVVVRHIRVRAGDANPVVAPTRSFDGISTGGGAHDVIVDHCSITWASDENLSASGPRFSGETPDEWRENTSHRITFSHSLIGEGTHPVNNKGTLLHDNVTEIAVVGNLYVSHNDRHPLFKGGVRAAVVNNFIYNPGKRVMQFALVPSQWAGRELQRAELVMVGNVARKGPSSAEKMVFFEVWPAYGPCDVYRNDNLFFDASGDRLSVEPAFRNRASELIPYRPTDGMRDVDSPPIWPPRLKPRPAVDTADWVLSNAGARPWDRDATDLRLLQEVRAGGGKVIRFESPAIRSTTP